MNLPPNRRLSDGLTLVGLLLLCIVLRGGVLSHYWSDLNDDRDAYLGIARGIADGRGFCVPGSQQPTAFRPPLYPLLLTPWADNEDQLQRAILHLVLAAGTVWCIWQTASQLGLSRLSRNLATLLIVIDPLLVRYIAFPMTETLCVFLSSLLLFRLTRQTTSLRADFATGLVFGACVLCRPTFWVFGGLYTAFLAGTYLIFGSRTSTSGVTDVDPSMPVHIGKRAMAVFAGVALLIVPWIGRNWLVLGTPVMMTTHGGYTVLLGNNEAFYREVVAQPWGTVWDGSHGGGQETWARQLNDEMDQLGIKTEVERDRWLGERARQTIGEHPGMFLRACLLRFLRFWNVVPIGPISSTLPAFVVWGLGTFYALLWMNVVWGAWTISRWMRTERPFPWSWVPLFFLVIGFVLVHLVYWSNARMRAPIMPALSLIAVSWLSPPKRQNTASSESD